MPVNSVLFTDKGRNDCPQLVSICFGLRGVVPHKEHCMVWAVVLEDETMTQVQFCCWLLELCFNSSSQNHPSSWFLPSLTRFPVPDTLKQPRSMMCLTAGMVSLGVCGLCDQSAPISSNLVKEHICSMHHFSQGSPSITSVWLFLGLQSFTDSKLG